MSLRWYVIKAVSGREDRARESIENQFRVYGKQGHCSQLLIPVEHVTEVKRGKKVTTKRKLYPGYIYAELELDQNVVEIINGIDNVTGFLGADPHHPEPLSSEEAERIVKIATATDADEQRAAIVQIPYDVGDRVKVKEGTFAGMDGVIDDINETKGTLRVLITVFGRQTPIELEVWQVEELA